MSCWLPQCEPLQGSLGITKSKSTDKIHLKTGVKLNPFNCKMYFIVYIISKNIQYFVSLFPHPIILSSSTQQNGINKLNGLMVKKKNMAKLTKHGLNCFKDKKDKNVKLFSFHKELPISNRLDSFGVVLEFLSV